MNSGNREYNSKCYTFKDFIKLSQGQFIINSMFEKIVLDYPNEIDSKKSKGEIVGLFIKNHFLKKDKIFDVIIYNEGKVIKFNLEE